MGTFYHKFRVVIICCSIVAMGGICYGLYMTNQKGFSGRWTLYAEEILKKEGIHASIDSFRYSVFDGLSSKSLTVYCPDDPDKKLVEFGKVKIEVENDDITKGKLELNRIELTHGEGWIDLLDEQGNRIHITDLSCKINLSKGNDLIVEEAVGRVYDIPISLKGVSLGATRPRSSTEGRERKPIEVPDIIRQICRVLYEVSTTSASAPSVNIDYLLDSGRENGLSLDISVKGKDFSYRGLNFRSIDSELHYGNKVLTLTKMDCLDDTGPLTLTGAFHVSRLNGDFQIDSRTNLQKILRAFSIDSVANRLVTPLPPILKASGTVQATRLETGKLDWDTQMHGHITLNQFHILETDFQSMDTDFSWRDDKLFLRDMIVRHDQGEVRGKILFIDNYIRYEAVSDLPPPLYRPFIKEGGIIARNIAKTDFRDDSSILINVKGTMQRDQLDQWEATGSIDLGNISYNGVPLKLGQTDFNFSPSSASFDDIAVTFAYNSYIPSSYARVQPSSGTVTAESVEFNPSTRTVEISDLRGQAWIAPIINLFSRSVGSSIDRIAYLSAPSFFSANGVVALKGHEEKTDLVCQFLNPTSLHYNLLGEDVYFQNTTGTVHLKGRDVLLKNISAQALGGQLVGNFRVTPKTSEKPKGEYEGNISFTKVALDRIADRYSLENKTDGSLTGRMSFIGQPGSVRELDGEGFIALDQADLFYIPIFGPLSPILSGILGDKKNSHEHVNSVSASFVIKKGNVYTNDIASHTPSAIITGKGLIDLDQREMDIAVQTKTRGLLGFLTLPIKPLEGKLLLFRGTGSISNPTWKNAAFDDIPEYFSEKQEVNRAIIVD